MSLESTLEYKLNGKEPRHGGVTDPEIERRRVNEAGAIRAQRLLKRALARRIRRRSLAAAYADQTRLLSSSEERVLAARIKAGDVESQQKLITANLRLVFMVVNAYRCCGVPEEDLIQEGSLGLIRAARHFDPAAHPTRFASYARFWIRRFVVRALATNSSLIQLPAKSHLFRSQDPDAIDALQGLQTFGTHEPGLNTLYPGELAARSATMSGAFDQVRLPDHESPICANLGDEILANEPSPDRNLVENEDRELVQEALRRLSPFEAWVICERFGLSKSSLLIGGLSVTGRNSEKVAKRAGSAGDGAITGPCVGSYFQRSYLELRHDCGLSVFRLRQVEKTALDKLRGMLADRAHDGS